MRAIHERDVDAERESPVGTALGHGDAPRVKRHDPAVHMPVVGQAAGPDRRSHTGDGDIRAAGPGRDQRYRRVQATAERGVVIEHPAGEHQLGKDRRLAFGIEQHFQMFAVRRPHQRGEAAFLLDRFAFPGYRHARPAEADARVRRAAAHAPGDQSGGLAVGQAERARREPQTGGEVKIDAGHGRGRPSGGRAADPESELERRARAEPVGDEAGFQLDRLRGPRIERRAHVQRRYGDEDGDTLSADPSSGAHDPGRWTSRRGRPTRGSCRGRAPSARTFRG
jgi:hypothetical protein